MTCKREMRMPGAAGAVPWEEGSYQGMHSGVPYKHTAYVGFSRRGCAGKP
ncbi:MAG: hypothetical protein WB781_20875 [Candidatus Sulfotelmatobacter sp.]